MIRQLTQDEFVAIATNGIHINLYNNYVEDYIQNLVNFIEEASHDYYVSDFDNAWCEIAKSGLSVLKVAFDKNRINFYLIDNKCSESKKSAGIGIKIVYMHSVAWEAINNEGKINQPIESWPL